MVKEAEQVTPSGSFEAIVYYYPKDQRSGSQGHMTSGSSHMDPTQLPPGERKQVLADVIIYVCLIFFFRRYTSWPTEEA